VTFFNLNLLQISMTILVETGAQPIKQILKKHSLGGKKAFFQDLSVMGRPAAFGVAGSLSNNLSVWPIALYLYILTILIDRGKAQCIAYANHKKTFLHESESVRGFI